MIINRISENSCDKNPAKPAPDYNYNYNITYIQSQSKQQSRKRQIIWFNPPYNANVKTNDGKICMRLVDKHFPHHRDITSYKLFNRSNIKLSYSNMPTMNNSIWIHSSNIMKDPSSSNIKTCNCCVKIRLSYGWKRSSRMPYLQINSFYNY